MKLKTFLLLIILLVGVILMAGCTGTAPVPSITPTPQIIYVTVMVTPAMTSAPAAATTTAPVSVSTAAAPDPILHRFIRQYTDTSTGRMVGYEFKFYPDGTVNYREGLTNEVSGNIVIQTVIGEGSGTWSPLGSMTYLIKILSTAQSGAQVIRQYTLVMAHENPKFPGVTIPEHIESSYETDQINLGQQPDPNSMEYPELAKID